MKFLSKTCFSLLATSLIIGCGNNKVHNAGQAVKNTVKAHQIMGTWESECKDSEILSTSMKNYLKFSGSSFLKGTEYFTNGDCADKPAVSSQYEGTFKVGDSNVSAEDAKNIYFEYHKVTLMPLTEAGINLLNTVNFCGISDWKIGTRQDLTAQSANTLCPLEDIPQNNFDIFQVEDNKLFLGERTDHDLTSIENRPVELDRASPFHESSHEMDEE